MNPNSFAEFIRSKSFLAIIGVLVFFALMLGSFSAGMAVGYHKARASYAWGESYSRVFAGPRGGFMGDMMRDVDGRDYIEAHGVFGQIIKMEGQTLIIGGRDSLERIVTVLPDTAIRKFRDDVLLTDVKVGDTIVVVGSPSQNGGIQAQLIRIMPPVPLMTPQTNLFPR